MSYTTPENSMKRADEYYQEDNWEAALDTLHDALQNRRNRSNVSALEKIMVSSQILTKVNLKKM